MEKFGAVGLREELDKTPPGWSMEFIDSKTGESWTAIRTDDFNELLEKINGEDPNTEESATITKQ